MEDRAIREGNEGRGESVRERREGGGESCPEQEWLY